jgi:excisionase family DNA binding protein
MHSYNFNSIRYRQEVLDALTATRQSPFRDGFCLFPEVPKMVSDRSARNGSEGLPERKGPTSERGFAPPYDPEPLLDSEEAAKRLKIHPKTLQRYARQGYVHGFQIGTMWRFRASDIELWIAQQAG